MWILIAREAPPDVTYWPGRGALAALDAVGWPLLWVLVLSRLPRSVGIVGPFFVAVAVLCGIGRLHRAVCANHRYRFTTWRWGRVAVALLLLGELMKLTLHLSA